MAERPLAEVMLVDSAFTRITGVSEIAYALFHPKGDPLHVALARGLRNGFEYFIMPWSKNHPFDPSWESKGDTWLEKFGTDALRFAGGVLDVGTTFAGVAVGLHADPLAGLLTKLGGNFVTELASERLQMWANKRKPS